MLYLNRLVAIFFVLLFSLVSIPKLQADWTYVPDPGPGVCVDHCEAGGGGSGGGGPSGPTPEELRLEREQQDLNEAADDANDKGVDFYKKGDWENAIKYFEEALDYSPDNQDYLYNLQQAQQKMSDAKAARQLKSVEEHGRRAEQLLNEAASEEARKGFDTAGEPAGSLVYGGSGGSKEPAVPVSKRTPAIADLEHQISVAKKELRAREEKLKTLDPKKDAVEISKIKQEESTIESRINYLNFSIGEELKKPSQVTPLKTAQ